MKIFFPNVTLKMIPFIKLILERSTCKKIIFSRISLSNSNVLNINFASLFDSSNSELIRVIELNFIDRATIFQIAKGPVIYLTDLE